MWCPYFEKKSFLDFSLVTSAVSTQHVRIRTDCLNLTYLVSYVVLMFSNMLHRSKPYFKDILYSFKGILHTLPPLLAPPQDFLHGRLPLSSA